MTMPAEALRVAAGGVASTRGRMWRRRGHLHDLLTLATELRRAHERMIRELARTLASEAARALACRRRSWLHDAVAGLALDLARELDPGETLPAAAPAVERSLPPTARCAVCGAVIGRDRLMCFPHWSQVPRALQSDLVHADATDRPRLLAAAIAAVAKSRGRVPAWRQGKKPAEFFNRPTKRRALCAS